MSGIIHTIIMCPARFELGDVDGVGVVDAGGDAGDLAGDWRY